MNQQDETEKYKRRAMYWRNEVDKRDKRIHELEQVLRSIHSRIEEQLPMPGK